MIKPCPFCGELGTRHISSLMHGVCCIEGRKWPIKCGGDGLLFNTKEEALAAWNQRPGEERLEKVLRLAAEDLVVAFGGKCPDMVVPSEHHIDCSEDCAGETAEDCWIQYWLDKAEEIK